MDQREVGNRDMGRKRAVFHAILAAGLLLAAPAGAACRLALALGLDVSNSVDDLDYGLQHAGLLAALRDPVIQAAILEPDDHVALAVYEWSGRRHQEVVLGWTEIRTAGDLEAVLAVLSAHQRLGYGMPTAIGYALEFGREMFEAAPPCEARTLDVSGDGRNNDGMAPADAYRREDFGDILVNGLAIGGHETDIVIYYRREVLRGRGAFVEIAKTHADFPRAIRRKLERELTQHVMGALPAAGGGG